VLPGGGQDSYRSGDTTFRLGFQFTSGDEAFKGTRPVKNPPAQADIEWSRQLVSLELYHQASEKVGVGVALPYYEQDSDNRVTGATNHEAGIGDIAGYVLWSPWARAEAERRLFDSANVTFLVGLSLPTGDDLAGELPGLHSYHLGSGSEEYKLGARYVGWAAESVTVFAGAVGIIDGGDNRAGFRYGNSYDLYAGAGVQLSEALSAWFSVDVIERYRDSIGSFELPDSGGMWWFGELGAAARVGGGVTVEAIFDVPLYVKVHGIQPVAAFIASLGLRASF